MEPVTFRVDVRHDRGYLRIMRLVPVRRNAMRRALLAGRSVFGPNLQIPCPELAELIGFAGFDFVMLDGEHGEVWPRLGDLIRAVEAAGATALVRVPDDRRISLLTPLELGAGGVQVPFVETAAQAAAIVAHCRFPPSGLRGYSNVTRAARYALADPRTYARTINREILVVAQIESRLGVENAEAIARVPGIDMVFIGPADLAQAYGERSDAMTPRTRRLIRQLVKRLTPLTSVAISGFSRGEVSYWHRAGVRCFLTSSARPISGAFRSLRAELRAGLPRR